MAELLVNQYFQPPFIGKLSNKVGEEYTRWSAEKFKTNVYNNEWPKKPLKQRMQHVSLCLRKGLPTSFQEAVQILEKVCINFTGFEGMVFSDFVEQFGLSHTKLSLGALELFTQYGSAEFAIRPFIVQDESTTMKKMIEWSTHSNFHVRRLASEGCRPRLPWAMALPNFKKDPKLVIPILENLKNDPEEYVRKSVANHWNDITKDNPEVVLDHLGNWANAESKRTQWIVKHALRGLIKKGDPKALRILGFGKASIALNSMHIKTPKLKMGKDLVFEFEITNTGKESAQIVVDYIVYFMKANGQLAPKVFKLKNLELKSKEYLLITKRHNMKPISTRKYYGGKHQVAIQINGEVLGEASFELLV